MADEVLLGSIELCGPKKVCWIRVTAHTGWAATLRRLLDELCDSPEHLLVKLYVSDGCHFKEALRFHAP